MISQADRKYNTNISRQNTRVKDLEPMSFHFYYDQLVADADWNGRLDIIKLPIYTCENDAAPGHPDRANAPISKWR